jgi:hypothetical protein
MTESGLLVGVECRLSPLSTSFRVRIQVVSSCVGQRREHDAQVSYLRYAKEWYSYACKDKTEDRGTSKQGR